MFRVVTLALALNLSLGSFAFAQSSAQGPIRASIERHALLHTPGVTAQPRAEPTVSLEYGDRIRITRSDGASRIEGLLAAINEQTVMLSEGEKVVTIPRSGIAGIERWKDPSYGTGVGFGALAGAVSGAVLGFRKSVECNGGIFLDCESHHVKTAFVSASALSALGALIGVAVAPKGRWVAVPLKPS